ncbi:MAG: stage II sporulation protein D [Clostridia bacterium]|nr:stage II sporulation protein D [Clostridia bacterium]
MKIYALLTGLLCLIMIFCPLICVGAGKYINTESHIESTDNTDTDVNLLQTLSGKVVEISAKDYIIGAVAAEMPASYSTEALKAQAVASYTYYRWLKENADNADYDISDDSKAHQGYLSDEQLKEKWGDKYDSYKQKIENAVMSVMGECIMYENEPIFAAFHAISSGKTHSASDVFGEALPYLVSTSTVGDTLSPDFDSLAEYTPEELISTLSLKDTGDNLIKTIDTTDSGYVSKITIGEKSYSGSELASLLGLRSPTFSAEYKNGKYVFSVKGYGHGVGMSQYSADYMARQGSTYKEILVHFYKDTYIDKIL